jgi:hypothetical protein
VGDHILNRCAREGTTRTASRPYCPRPSSGVWRTCRLYRKTRSSVGGPDTACTSIMASPRSRDRRIDARSGGVSWRGMATPSTRASSTRPPYTRSGDAVSGQPLRSGPRRLRGSCSQTVAASVTTQRTDQPANSIVAARDEGSAKPRQRGARAAAAAAPVVLVSRSLRLASRPVTTLYCRSSTVKDTSAAPSTSDRHRQPARRSPAPKGTKRRRLRKTSTPLLFPQSRQSRGVAAAFSSCPGSGRSVRNVIAIRPTAASHRPAARSRRVTAVVRGCSPRPPSGGSAGRRPGRPR